MGAPRIVEVGERYGRLTVVRQRGPRESHVLCRCDCGTVKEIRFGDMGRRTLSCGCYFRERVAETSVKHGMSTTKLFRAWAGMIARCTNPHHQMYAYYGGRGITVCERWMSFENFYADMGARPDGYTLDRVNNDGNYEPGNCRWATRSEQAYNRRPRTLAETCKVGHPFTDENTYISPSNGRRTCKTCQRRRDRERGPRRREAVA